MTKDTTFVNRDYHNPIHAEMRARLERGEQPTVKDTIITMNKQGTVDYYDAWPEKYIDKGMRIKEFVTSPHPFHSVAHLMPRLGHTPQHEYFVGLTQMGMQLSLQDSYRPISKELTALYRHLKDQLKKFSSTQEMQRIENPSKRDEAIYFAMGLYYGIRKTTGLAPWM